jgi:thioredoxin 1
VMLGGSARPLSPKELILVNKDVLVLTDDNWKKEVAESETPVLVDFWAEWCPPCRMIAPSIDALATEYSGRVKVGKVNVDENPIVAQAFGIRSIPTLLVFRDGHVADQQIGAVPQARIAQMLERNLDSLEAASRKPEEAAAQKV